MIECPPVEQKVDEQRDCRDQFPTSFVLAVRSPAVTSVVTASA
jgi:hypothetical protein